MRTELVPFLVCVGVLSAVTQVSVNTQAPPPALQVVLEHSLNTADCATATATLEKGAATEVTCRNTEIRFRVRQGQSLSTTDIARAASTGGRPNSVVLRSITAFGRVDLVLSGQHDPADDAVLVEALAQRRGVTTARVVSPRRLGLEILPANPLAVGALVQTYVRALSRKGPTLLTDFLSEVVFHGV